MSKTLTRALIGELDEDTTITKKSAIELINKLDEDKIKAEYADRGLQGLLEDVEKGWEISHVHFRHNLLNMYKGNPGFVFIAVDPKDKSTEEFTEVTYGPKAREFVLKHCYYVYVIKN